MLFLSVEQKNHTYCTSKYEYINEYIIHALINLCTQSANLLLTILYFLILYTDVAD